MFGLAEQVRGAKFAVDCVVCDDHGFGGASEQVNADAAEQLAFCFGHKGVAGADEHVDGINGFCAKSHRADGLDAAHDVNIVRAAKVHCSDHGCVWLAFEGRRAGDNAGYFGDRCRGDGHVRRGDHREFTARNVAADGLHRDVFVPQNHARHRFDFDIEHAIALGLGEFADVFLGEFDVGKFAIREGCDQGVDFGLRQFERRGGVVVEFFGQFAYGGVATRFDLFERAFHDGAGFGVVVGAILRGAGGFEVGDGHVWCPVFRITRVRVAFLRHDRRFPSLCR